MSPKKPPENSPSSSPGGDEEDWASALDDWGAKLDSAFSVEGDEPTTNADKVEPLPTEINVPTLPSPSQPIALAPLADEMALDEPAPLDEPPPLDSAPLEAAFALDAETAKEPVLSRGDPAEDPLRDLFEGDLFDPPAEAVEPVTRLESASPSPFDEPVDAGAGEIPVEIGEPPEEAARGGSFDEPSEERRTNVLVRGEPAPAPAPQAIDDEDDELEISVAFDQAAEVAAQAAADDEDFYDDMVIVPGRDEPSLPKPAPERPAEPEEAEVLEEPVLARRDDDPDRTPLPVDDAEPGFVSALRLSEPAIPPAQRDLVAARPTAPSAPLPALSTNGDVVAFSEEERRAFLGLVDTERLLADASKVPLLGFEAALTCLRLGDQSGADERIDAALRADEKHIGALRLARRAAFGEGDVNYATELIERERAVASTREAQGFAALAAALADRRGQHPEARAFDSAQALEGEAAAGARFAAAAFAEDRLAALLACRESVSPASDPRLAAALDLEIARLEAEPGAALERLRAVLAADPRNLAAGLGLWRVAVAGSPDAAEATALTLVAEALPPGLLRAAVERRAAGVTLAAGGEGGRERLGALADAGDDLSAVFLLDEPTGGQAVSDPDVARTQRAVTLLLDPGQRAAARIALGAVEEAREHVGAAIAAYTEAAREFPADRRAERALERARSLGGDKQAELDHHLRTAGTDEARAQWSLVRAAALFLELDRADEAFARVGEALDRRPTDGEALMLCASAAAALGKGEQAADRLLAAVEATSDRALANSLRRRAALLYAGAGAIDKALTAAAVDSEPAAVADLARRIGLGDSARVHALLGELAERAAPLDAARALVERASLATAAESIDDLRRAVTLAPAHRGAAALLIRRLRQEPAVIAAFLSDRFGALASLSVDAPVVAERNALAIEAALSMAEEGDAPEAAARLLAGIGDGGAAVAAELTRLGRAHGLPAPLTAAYERAIEEVASPDLKAALHYEWGRAAQRGGEDDRGVEQLRLAHEALPEASIYRDALERAWERTGDSARLTDLALADLKEASDTRRKVAAYARLAFIDESLRGDPASARMSYESIAELDQNNHDAARRLERMLIGERRGADLIHLYDRVGIAASEPALAVAVSLERARLRRKHATPDLDAAELDAAIDNDLRLALFQDPRSRPALREAFARAGERRDASARLSLGTQLAELVGGGDQPDTRASAIFLVRAAQAAQQLNRLDDAKARLRDAIARSDAHLPALILLADQALSGSDLATAAEAFEQLQRVQREPTARREAGLVAAAIAARDLNDRGRAIRILRAVLEADPRATLAFERLRVLLTEGEEWAPLAEAIAARLQTETDGRRLVRLHVELGRLYRERLGDPARARQELSAALAQDGASLEALSVLADVEEGEGRWAEAADLLMRRAKLERSRTELAQLLYRLGSIYGRHIGDAKRAIACLARVLQVDPNHKDSIELLADCYGKEWDWKGALGALQKLVSIETVPHKRVAILHRAAQIQEEGFKEPRHALSLYRAALELDPLYMPGVEALAKFFDRQSDVQSLRVLCDTSARRIRAGMLGGAREREGYRALYALFQLRRAPDRTAIAAGVLEWSGQGDDETKRALERLRTREQYPGAALADPSIDDLLFDSRAPAGLRNLLRLVEEPLRKGFRAEVKQLGVQKQDRLGKSGHALRDVANRVAADLGVRDFELYLAPSLGKQAVLELTDPLSLCIGAELVEGAHELQLRFLMARYFKIAQLQLALALRLPPDGLAALIAGVVRQFAADYAPSGVDPAAIAAEATRAQKALPRKLAGELHPFALEVSGAATDLRQVAAGLQAAADRAGLLACGAPQPALTMLERMGLTDSAAQLARFALGDELAELRRIAGTGIG